MIPDLTLEIWLMILGGVSIFGALSIYSIWDAFHRDFGSTGEKMAWIQLAILVPFLGGLAYLLIGKRRGERVQ